MKLKGVELGDVCALCGATKKLEIHHIVPISKGGTNEIENLAVLCRKCNQRVRNNIVPIIREQFKILQFGGDGTRENLRYLAEREEKLEREKRRKKEVIVYTRKGNMETAEIRIAGYLKIQGGGRIQIPKVTLEEYNIEQGDLIWIGKGEIIKKKGGGRGEKMIPLEQQVTSLKFSKRLKELGVKQR